MISITFHLLLFSLEVTSLLKKKKGTKEIEFKARMGKIINLIQLVQGKLK